MHNNRKRARWGGATVAFANNSGTVGIIDANIGLNAIDTDDDDDDDHVVINDDCIDDVNDLRGITVARTSATTTAHAMLNASIAGQSIYLHHHSNNNNNNNNHNSSNNNNDHLLPANVFLTICDDDNSNADDETPEYLIDANVAHIKQEQDAATQTTSTLPLQQYRLLHNQLPRETLKLETHTNNCSPVDELTAAALLPASVQLPSGCEIYLVKEYVSETEKPAALLQTNNTNVKHNSNNNNHNNNVNVQVKNAIDCQTFLSNAGVSVKLEPGVSSTTQLLRRSASANILNNNNNINKSRVIVNKNNNNNNNSTTQIGNTGNTTQSKRNSYLLESYKKRDDKRRATHNEVERRRRDKINSWIFKLKEMLPPADMLQMNQNTTTTTTTTTTIIPDVGNNNNNNNNNVNSNNNNNMLINNRTPPCDSKSQILIKACEYIKTLQDEIKSLRACLTENENLRASNQRLQHELQKLQQQQQNIQSNNNNNNSSNIINDSSVHNNSNSSTYNLTLNALNSNAIYAANGNNNNNNNTTTTLGLIGSTVINSSGNSLLNNLTTNSYTKRELIIRDYVD